jgi:hypothetical protein
MPPRINIPPVTRVALGALVVQSFLSAAIRYRQWTSTSDVVIPYLTLVPQLSLFYPWTFLSTTLVENNIFTISIAGATLYYGGRYLERAWSSAELAKFLILVALIPNALTFLVLIILFTLSRNEHWTYVVYSPRLTLLRGRPPPPSMQLLTTSPFTGSPSSTAPSPSRSPSSSPSASSFRRTPSPSSAAFSPSGYLGSRSSTSAS